MWLKMMEQFNLGKVVVYNTIQLYRSDRLSFLSESLQAAEKSGYIAGLKLVRGAYMEKERDRAEELGYSSPIHGSKEATDEAYNTALRFCIDHHDKFCIHELP